MLALGIFFFVLGALMGSTVEYIIRKVLTPPKVGRLIYDHSDPEGPYLFLELDRPIQTDKVTLEVKNTCYISTQTRK